MAFMDLLQLYNNCLADFNTQQGGCLRPYSNFNMWLNNISTEMFNDFFSTAELSQKNDDKLNQYFLRSVNIPITPMPGKNFDKIELPADYGYFSSARVFLSEEMQACLCKDHDILDLNDKNKCKGFEDEVFKQLRNLHKGELANERPVSKLDNARFGSAADHRFKRPTIKDPIVTQVNGYLKIVPRDVGIIVLDYFRLPKKAYFAYTTVPGTDAVQYDLANSIQLDWPDLVQPELLARLKQKYASSTRNTQQYSEAVLEKKEAK